MWGATDQVHASPMVAEGPSSPPPLMGMKEPGVHVQLKKSSAIWEIGKGSTIWEILKWEKLNNSEIILQALSLWQGEEIYILRRLIGRYRVTNFFYIWSL